jgi:cyanuric acid amidohydrolase
LAASNQLDLNNVVAILGKTEGNGCVNDFTRGYATFSLKDYFSNKIGEKNSEKIIYIMSGGTEGILTPHLTVFAVEKSESTRETSGGLSIGIGRTREFLPSEIGTMTMVSEVADTVKKVLSENQINVSDTHFVQIKCPLLTASKRQNCEVKTEDSYKSMAYSRGASALGVAVALGEISIDEIDEKDICTDFSKYSSIASTSAGVEVQSCEIIIFGNSSNSKSDFFIQHDVMKHALDCKAIDRALKKIQIPVESVLTVFAKAEADPSGEILNRRHTMLDDSDISHTRMARAVVGASLASVINDPMIYVSGGSEHQGPSGGGPLAVIAKLKTKGELAS